MSDFTHLDARGEVRMVDVTAKPVVFREAIASAEIRLRTETVGRIETQTVAKGNVLATARIAGIQAAKRTGDLIPLCHPLAITKCEIDFEIPETRDRIVIRGTVGLAGRTGVEMEALTAVAVAALTIYDMCKAIDREMVVGQIRLESKRKEPSAEA